MDIMSMHVNGRGARVQSSKSGVRYLFRRDRNRLVFRGRAPSINADLNQCSNSRRPNSLETSRVKCSGEKCSGEKLVIFLKALVKWD